MLKASKLIAFVATRDAARAKLFYQKILGLDLVSEDPSAVVFDANGTMIRMQKVEKLPRVEHTILGWDVPDIRKTMDDLRSRGVVFERYSFLEQDADGVWKAPSGAQIAWFKDPDGNTLSLTQF
jgi:catechol 2,3-dioxygenase-like lactoylglutathione lyase family enzyme